MVSRRLCEERRDEAIHSFFARRDGLLRFARNDGLAHFRVLAARFRPSYNKFLASPSKQRAQGMPGARCTRGLVCQELHIWRTRAYRAAETLRHPLRNGFTAYIVLSPVERACCHRHP